MPDATVTEIHLCARCPRLLAYLRAGEKNVWKIGLKGSGNFPGSFFHDKIAKPFHRALSGKRPSALKTGMNELLAASSDSLAETIHKLLKNHILDPALDRHASRLNTDQIMTLAEGVARWAKYLALFLEKWVGDQNGEKIDVSEIVRDPERKLEHAFSLPCGRTLLVSGIFDALMVDGRTGRAMVVEFKGFEPANEDEDFLQAAMYGLLIEKETGIVPSCAVLYMEDEQPEAFYSEEVVRDARKNLESLMETVCEVISNENHKGKADLGFTQDRVLCDACPFDSRCDADWGPRRETTSIEPEDGERDEVREGVKTEEIEKPEEPEKIEEKEKTEEAENAMGLLLKTLRILRLPSISEGYIAGPRLIRLRIKPDLEKGVTVRKIMSRADDLQIAMKLKAPPLIRAQAGYLSIDIPRKIRRPLTLLELWEKEKDSGQRRSSAAFPIGMAIDGSVEWADLTNPAMTSILVAGTAGSGKSVFLRSAVLGMALNAGPDEIKFTLIDPKRVTFTDFSEIPHLKGPPIMDLGPALEELEKLVYEMEERYDLLSNAGAIDISEYNARNAPLEHHVTIIDEYADLMIEKDFKQRAELLIQRLCQKGRAAGFHIVLSTQRPDSKVVTPLIKANLQLKIALKVTTLANSRIVLDEPGAERLMGNGDMLAGGAVPLMRLQGPLPTKTERLMVEGKVKRKGKEA